MSEDEFEELVEEKVEKITNAEVFKPYSELK